MLRKNLGPDDLDRMPSFLGRIFRVALQDGVDTFDYTNIYELYDNAAKNREAELKAALEHWSQCRDMLGMHTPLDTVESRRQKKHPAERQQYVRAELP
jgi:hypothetical protein